MSGTEGDDYGEDQLPTHHPPWPAVNPFAQRRFERQFLADGETIDFSSLPQSPHRVYGILKKVSEYSISAGRPITAIEANAIAKHDTQSAGYLNLAPEITTAVSAFAAWRGRHTFRFPFYTPNKETFNPYVFPSTRLPLRRGRVAFMLWHLTRMFAYSPLLFIPTLVFFGSIRARSFQLRMTNDQSLSGLMKDVKQHRLEVFKQEARRRSNAPYPTGTAPYQGQRQMGNETYQDSASQYYRGDNYDTQSSNVFESSGRAPGASQPTTQSSWGQVNSTQSAPQKARNSTVPDSFSRYEDDIFDNPDDDASPVAPSARKDDARSSSSSGSAWDRIRQQANSGNSTWEKGDSSGQEHGWGKLRQDKARNPKDFTPKADSYSYSSEDEEKEKRNYEKEKAQKDFDALVDAERRGESGGGSSSSSRGWRR
ncbi:hypothetical protein F4861DRAFT_406315 [Xylaria intraflava]|nr:hypothetical protein F4861DRAFT_406315 [Xylaria intraflava]